MDKKEKTIKMYWHEPVTFDIGASETRFGFELFQENGNVFANIPKSLVKTMQARNDPTFHSKPAQVDEE